MVGLTRKYQTSLEGLMLPSMIGYGPSKLERSFCKKFCNIGPTQDHQPEADLAVRADN